MTAQVRAGPPQAALDRLAASADRHLAPLGGSDPRSGGAWGPHV